MLYGRNSYFMKIKIDEGSNFLRLSCDRKLENKKKNFYERICADNFKILIDRNIVNWVLHKIDHKDTSSLFQEYNLFEVKRTNIHS